jgi:hypothetical protein
MGGAAPSKQEDITSHFMPLYYVKEPVDSHDIDLCSATWLAILGDEVPKYKEMCNSPGFAFNSCRIYFYTMFYSRLVALRPELTGAFRNGIDTVGECNTNTPPTHKDIKLNDISSGSFMTKMLSVSLNQLENPKGFHEAMTGLATRHCQRGIQTYEYFSFGDVLFHALEETLGSMYTYDVDRAWKSVYSSMLSVIVPVTLSFGLKMNSRGQTPSEMKRNLQMASSFSESEACPK